MQLLGSRSLRSFTQGFIFGIYGVMKRAFLIIFVALAIAAAVGAEGLEFEVASVRLASPPAFGIRRGGPGTSDPTRVSYSRVLMRTILITAFDLQPDELVAPSWIMNYNAMTDQSYDIEATMPAGTTKEQANQMMQSLLKERFHLSFHFDKRDIDGYSLVVAKNGPKLKAAAPPDGPPPKKPDVGGAGAQVLTDQDGFPVLPNGYPDLKGLGSADGYSRITAKMMPLSMLLGLLEGRLKIAHIIDKTGLTGTFDFRLEFGSPVPQQGPTANQNDPSTDLFSALQGQLGLRLEKTKIHVDVLVIDHIDTFPTEN